MAEGERVSRGALPASTVIIAFLRSAVGAKVIMGITGAALWLFVIAHLIGNLQIFQGAEPINEYGVFLRELGHGAVLWVVRGLLLLAFVAHIAFGIRLAALNRSARPTGYQAQKFRAATVASRMMTASGLLILTFLIFHLAHTTWGLVLPKFYTMTKLADGRDAHDVFTMMSMAFREPWMVLVYVLGQAIVLLHLYHGTQSLWQSIGWHHGVWTPVLSLLGRTIAVLIMVLNVSMPVALFFAWMQK